MSTQRCFLNTNGCQMVVKSKGLKALRVTRVLRKSGLGYLEVKVLAWNARDVGLNPTWFKFFPLVLDVRSE